MSRLIWVAAAVLSAAFSVPLVVAQPNQAAAAKAKSDTSGQVGIKVVNGQRLPAADVKELDPLPDFLRGSTVFRPAGNTLEFTANQDVLVLVAASWVFDGDASGNWGPGRTSLWQLVAQGWEPIAAIGRNGPAEHTLLRRQLKKGEKVKFYTRKFNPPLAILPASDTLTAIARLKSQPITSNDISAIRPAAGAKKEGKESVVILRSHEPDRREILADRGLLLRELVRQAVLLSARDELGLATRDETLREHWDQNDEGMPPLDIVVKAEEGGRYCVTLFRFSGGKADILWDKEFSLEGEDQILALTKEAERLSREEFPAALHKAEFSGKRNLQLEDAPVPEALEQALPELHWLDQFSVARQLHQLLRKEGESPQRLAALAQVYAQLGVLTEHLWYPGHKAHKARALLYAERAVAKWPESAEARYGRGFVRALLGLHAAALDALKEADVKATIPPWKPAIEAFVRFDEARLAELSARGSDDLPRLLRLMSVERQAGPTLIVPAAESLLATVPDCDRVMDTLWHVGELGTRRQAVTDGPSQAALGIYNRLQALSDLPPATSRLMQAELDARAANDVESADEANRRVELVRSLRAAGEIGRDSAEPSWQVLATMIEETSFFHAERQLDFLLNVLGAPMDETLSRVEPLVADHPYRAFIAAHCDNPQQRIPHLKALATSLRPQDLSLNEIYLLHYLSMHGFPQHYQNLSPLMMQHQDYVYNDVLVSLQWSRGATGKQDAARLLRLSPHSPTSITSVIRFDWEAAAPHAAEWEKQFAGAELVQKALGQQYLLEGKYADAARCLERAAKITPDYITYNMLAESWLKQKDERRFLAVWDEFLKTPAYGLTHAQVRVRIADYFMAEGRFEEALPYAEQAAETWAEWAMMSAGDCLTALKRYDEAEVYFQRVSQRYLTAAPRWYLWCLRTGQGNVDAAKRHAEQALNDASANVFPEYRATCLILDGKKEAALAGLEKWLAQREDPVTAWLAVLLAEELKQPVKRDAYLQILVRMGERDEFRHTGHVALAKIVLPALAEPEKMATLAPQVDTLLKKMSPSQSRAEIAGIAGKFLDLNGLKEGVDLMKVSADAPHSSLHGTLSAVELKTRRRDEK